MRKYNFQIGGQVPPQNDPSLSLEDLFSLYGAFDEPQAEQPALDEDSDFIKGLRAYLEEEEQTRANSPEGQMEDASFESDARINYYEDLLRQYDDFDYLNGMEQIYEQFDHGRSTAIHSFTNPSDTNPPNNAVPYESGMTAVNAYNVKGNNPGNLMGKNGKIASYPDYATGRAKLENQIERYKSGATGFASPLTKKKMNGESTLLEAIHLWAPKGHGANDPNAYAKFVAKKLGLSINTKIKDIDTKSFADAITMQEHSVNVFPTESKEAKDTFNFSTNYSAGEISPNLKLGYGKVGGPKADTTKLKQHVLNGANYLSDSYPGIVITSTTEGKHTKGSAHYDNEAFDVGRGSSSKEAYNKMKADIEKWAPLIGAYVLDEGNHLHISFSTKGKK